MEAYDIKSTDNDLVINTLTGDFEISTSDDQHIEDIITAFTGWFKEFPSLGVGIKQYQASAGQEQTIERSIKLQLQGDGYSVAGAKVDSNPNGTFTIWPNAIRK